MVMVALSGLAIVLAVIPLRFIFLGIVLYIFIMNSKLAKRLENNQGNRRLKEWWDSIPIIPVRVSDKVPDDNRVPHSKSK